MDASFTALPLLSESLLPGGPYDLWKEGETLRRVKDLASAFAQHPHLPKMLNACSARRLNWRKSLVFYSNKTLSRGCGF